MKDLGNLLLIVGVAGIAYFFWQQYNANAAATQASNAANTSNPTQQDDGTQIFNDLSNLVGGGL